MEMIAKISKGSRMDQIYIPKKRGGFLTGQYVIILPLEKQLKTTKPYFYGIKNIEPIKLKIIDEIFSLIDRKIEYENAIITGSFLDKGFNFKDIDLIIIGEEVKEINGLIEELTGIKAHVIFMDNETLRKGLSTDPLYQLMLGRCISRKRIIHKIKPEINYKLLDLHLLKSKMLIDNFDILDGNEKYYLTRNMISILLFIKNKKISKEEINKEIKKNFYTDAEKIKKNLLNKGFLDKYKKVYNKTFNLIMRGGKL